MRDIHIDPHVHCRDWDQSNKTTIKKVTELAKSQGVYKLFDMPNTKPPILTETDVERRLKTANEEGCSDEYYTYIGIIMDLKQIREAAELAKNHPRVIGIKMYADHILTDEASQLSVYRELANIGYDGVLTIHAEKRDLFHEELWNPVNPQTWNLVRPIEAEIESVKDQIKFAIESNFEGKLYFAHITTKEAVDIIRDSKNDLDVYCAVTPHHTTYSTLNMKGRQGLKFKVNPPLREIETMKHLRNYTINGAVDVIETDHAPHTIQEKMHPPYASGIQSLKVYSKFLNGLRRDGITEELIHEMTNENIREIFEKI